VPPDIWDLNCMDGRYLEVSGKKHGRHMLPYRNNLGRFALFAVYEGIIIHKIVLVYMAV